MLSNLFSRSQEPGEDTVIYVFIYLLYLGFSFKKRISTQPLQPSILLHLNHSTSLSWLSQSQTSKLQSDVLGVLPWSSWGLGALHHRSGRTQVLFLHWLAKEILTQHRRTSTWGSSSQGLESWVYILPGDFSSLHRIIALSSCPQTYQITFVCQLLCRSKAVQTSSWFALSQAER